MAILYKGLSSGAQVTRGYWRVTLAVGLHIEELFARASLSWATSVEQWRTKVEGAGFVVPAQASPAAIGQDRAVVDVFILGAPSGLTVSGLADTMDHLVRGMDVLTVESIIIAESTGRGAVLQQAEADAARESWTEQLKRLAEKSAAALLTGAIVVALGYLVITRRILK